MKNLRAAVAILPDLPILGLEPMPIIIPPYAFDVPAIVRVAAHAPANPGASRLAVPAVRSKTVPSPGAQPLGTGEGPQLLSPTSPVPPPPPPPTTTSSSTRTR